jgi:hypothetical protein
VDDHFHRHELALVIDRYRVVVDQPIVKIENVTRLIRFEHRTTWDCRRPFCFDEFGHWKISFA